MRILHLLLDPVMWQPIQFHIQNLHYLEGQMGHLAYIDYSCSEGFSVDNYKNIDLVHMHGWPMYSNSVQFLHNIKSLLLSNKKIVVSMYDYAAICGNGCLSNGYDVECSPQECKFDACSKLTDITEIAKSFPTFVYSNSSEAIFREQGFNKVHKMPLCCFGAKDEYTRPSYNDGVSGRLAIFDIGLELPLESEIISKIKNEKKIKSYSINNILYQPFEVNYGFIPMAWPHAAPAMIGITLRTGAPVIVVGNYGKDFSDMSKHIHHISWDDDILSRVLEICSIHQSKDERNEVAYNFWKNYGPDLYLSWYSSAYDFIMKNY